MKKKGRVRKKARQVKNEIKEEVLLNVPNTVTLSRLILGFVFIYLLFAGYSNLVLTIVFAVAAFSDALDGFLARKLKQTTSIGARLDQVIDRVFTALIVIPLVIKFAMESQTFFIVQLVMISSREIVGLPGLVIRNIRNVDAYKVKSIGKMTTFIQGFALGSIILGVSWSIYLVIPTMLIGVVSGLDYLRDSLE